MKRIPCAVIDGAGIYGGSMHYALVIFFVTSAFIIFLYLWRKKRLDMDEEPKFQMMTEEQLPKGESPYGSSQEK